MFNNNIRCIEINWGVTDEQLKNWFNNNIRCIEMILGHLFILGNKRLITT